MMATQKIVFIGGFCLFALFARAQDTIDLELMDEREYQHFSIIEDSLKFHSYNILNRDVIIGCPRVPYLDKMPEPVGGYASIINRVIYPSEAIEGCLEGRVIVETLIDTSGQCKNSKILAGSSIFLESAIAAIEATQFTPAEQRGLPIAVRISIPVVFKLDEKYGCEKKVEIPFKEENVVKKPEPPGI